MGDNQYDKTTKVFLGFRFLVFKNVRLELSFRFISILKESQKVKIQGYDKSQKVQIVSILVKDKKSKSTKSQYLRI